MADTPRREHPIVNPEQCASLLRRIVTGWDQDDREAFMAAVTEARAVAGLPVPWADRS